MGVQKLQNATCYDPYIRGVCKDRLVHIHTSDHTRTLHPFRSFVFFKNHRITPPAQGGAVDSVSLLLIKKPACSFICPVARHTVSRLNGSCGPARTVDPVLGPFKNPLWRLSFFYELWAISNQACSILDFIVT